MAWRRFSIRLSARLLDEAGDRRQRETVNQKG